MKEAPMQRAVHSFGASFAAAVSLAALVFVAEALFPGLEKWSEEAFGHAWLHVGTLALAVFVLAGLAPIRFTSTSRGVAVLVAGAAIAGSVVIAAVSALAAAFG